MTSDGRHKPAAAPGPRRRRPRRRATTAPPPPPQDEAGLNHLCWHERDAAGAAVEQAEMDVVIIPGEASFGKVCGLGAAVLAAAVPPLPPSPPHSKT